MRTYTIIHNDEQHQVSIETREQGYELTLDGKTHRFVPLLKEAPLYSFLIDGAKVLEADISFNRDHCELNVRNLPYQLEVFDPRRRVISQADSAEGGGLVQAPMPGKVVDVKVKAGDPVKKGDAVVIIEAMKMQNELAAERDGVIQEIAVKTGDTVEAGQKLVVIAKAGPAG